MSIGTKEVQGSLEKSGEVLCDNYRRQEKGFLARDARRSFDLVPCHLFIVLCRQGVFSVHSMKNEQGTRDKGAHRAEILFLDLYRKV
jgi:hypothetical protein